MTNKEIPSQAINPGIPTRPEHIFLGRVADGDVAWAPNVNPHILISGSPGSGKTVFLQNLAEQCRIQNWLVFVMNGQPADSDVWLSGRNFDTTNDLVSSVHMLDEVLSILQSRYSTMEAEGVVNYAESTAKLIPILVVIDSLDAIVESRENVFLSSDENLYGKHFASVLASITRFGRAAGVFVAASTTSSLSSELFTNETSLNFGTRITIGSEFDKDSRATNENQDYSEVGENLGRGWISVYGSGEEVQLYGPVV